MNSTPQSASPRQVFVDASGKGTLRQAVFSRANGRYYGFFTTADAASAAALRTELEAAGQRVVSQLDDPSGAVTLIGCGSDLPERVVEQLRGGGHALRLPQPAKQAFDPWKWRGITSIGGQSLQIASSFLSRTIHAGDRMAIFGFAALNMLANASNIIFGAQEKHDPHQLRYLKESFNARLAPDLPAGAALSDPDATSPRAAAAPAPSRTLGQKTYDFMQKYSVSGGEIGLRMLGSASLVMPITRWGDAVRTLRDTGSLKTAVSVASNPNVRTFRVGLLMLLGKCVSLISKEPDPYNPDPPGWLDRFRQRYTFRLSSLIEAGAASYMMHDRLKNQKIELGGKLVPDYVGAAGNAMFVTGYGIRLSAPYGSREVDQGELIAHMTHGLAQLPPEKLPQQLAQSAAWLAEHFNKPELDVADIYTRLASELERGYGIVPGQAGGQTTSAAVARQPIPRITPVRDAQTQRVAEGPELAAGVAHG